MQTILMIGGAGYVGNPMASYFLNNGYKVVIIDNFIYGHRSTFLSHLCSSNIIFHNLDIASVSEQPKLHDIVKDCDYVVILAGLVGDPITKKYPERSNDINNIAIRNLILSLSKSEGKRIVFVSTCSNYGLMPEGVLANENSELSPLSYYAEAKVKNEELCINLAQNNDITITVLRFATAFGLSARMRFDLTVNQFTRSLTLGEKLEVFDADTWRPYCHVKDFARLVLTVFESKESLVKGEIFNAGGDFNNYTKRKLVELISSKLNKVNVNYKRNGSDPRNYRVSFEKVEKKLGFVPNYSVEYGVEEVISAVKNGFFKDDIINNTYGNYLL